jgi:hypothetical protein
MKKIVLLLFIASLSWACMASAGEIAKVFSGAIFDLKWLSVIDEVRQKYPNGQLKSEYGLASYRIYGGRKVFKIERDKSNYIDFWFNSENQLNFVSIQFPSTSPESLNNLLTKLTAYFGPQSENAKAAGNTLVVQWPADEGFIINLTNTVNRLMDDELVFGVGYTKPVSADKEKLGF